jgi:hypothetical protein
MVVLEVRLEYAELAVNVELTFGLQCDDTQLRPGNINDLEQILVVEEMCRTTGREVRIGLVRKRN